MTAHAKKRPAKKKRPTAKPGAARPANKRVVREDMAPATEYVVPAGKVLVLRTCFADMRSPSGDARGFVWPRSGPVEAKDWNPKPVCGYGLHGALWGEGAGGSPWVWADDGVWLVVEVDADAIVDLGGKVKFPRGVVVFSGPRLEATTFLAKRAPGRAIVGGTATAGYGGTATAGDGGTATAGYRGTATAGDRGELRIREWDLEDRSIPHAGGMGRRGRDREGRRLRAGQRPVHAEGEAMTAHAIQQAPASRRDQILALYRTDALIAAAIELHRYNGLPWLETLETLVLAQADDRARLQAELTAALRAMPPTVFALPGRDDDDHALCCGEVDCQCQMGGAA